MIARRRRRRRRSSSIGTSDDPATPGRHAAELAAALDDAVASRWEGVGHTAFPVRSCIDEIVADYLVDGVVPADGTIVPVRRRRRRPTPRSATTSSATRSGGCDRGWTDVLVATGREDEAHVPGDELAGADHRVLTHLLLGVPSTPPSTPAPSADAAC